MHRCTHNNRTISPLPLIWSLLLYSGAKIQKMKMTSISYFVTTWVTIYENSLISESVATLHILLCTGLTKLHWMRSLHTSKKKSSMCHIPFMYKIFISADCKLKKPRVYWRFNNFMPPCCWNLSYLFQNTFLVYPYQWFMAKHAQNWMLLLLVGERAQKCWQTP